MLCILNDHTEAAFNLAAEEYLLGRSQEDCCMLWRNQKAVIIGRNQNPWSQINASYVQRRRIPVLRRSSGGGTVFHDPGNINFTFIRCSTRMPPLDFRPFLEPIESFLQKLGMDVRPAEAGALTLGERKISGNAQFIHRGRVLHHGTLLFDVDLQELDKTLCDNSASYRGTGVNSIRKPVTNLKPHLDVPGQVTDFMTQLLGHIQKTTGGRRGMLLPADRRKIDALAQDKYRTWRWNFGRSPFYTFHKMSRLNGRQVEVHLEVRSGIIQRARLHAPCTGSRTAASLEAALTGCRHTPPAVIRAATAGRGADRHAPVDAVEELISALF